MWFAEEWETHVFWYCILFFYTHVLGKIIISKIWLVLPLVRMETQDRGLSYLEKHDSGLFRFRNSSALNTTTLVLIGRGGLIGKSWCALSNFTAVLPGNMSLAHMGIPGMKVCEVPGLREERWRKDRQQRQRGRRQEGGRCVRPTDKRSWGKFPWMAVVQ